MATSNKQCAVTDLLIVFAMVIAHNLQPSAAIRIDKGAIKAAADELPTPGGPQPTECRPLLQGMLPCAAFLSEPGVYAPDQACCDGFNAMFAYDAISCACHVVDGEISQILPAPARPARVVELFAACGRQNVPVDRFAVACRATVVPPIDAVVPLPSPPSPPGWSLILQ